MGADGSHMAYFDQLILQPSREPICATEPRFCLQNPIQLYLRERAFSFSGDDFSVTDTFSGAVYFLCAGSAFSFVQKKVLLDNMRTPVLNIENEWFSFTHKFNIYAGAEPIYQICQIDSDFTFMGASMHTAFWDVITRRQQFISLQGNWNDKRCVIYHGNPQAGGIPIAKIYKPYTGRSMFLNADEYILEVAAGVDIALMVTMCITLDEHSHDSRRHSH